MFTTKPIRKLQRGYVYLFKDGRIGLYLGKDVQNKHVFYVFGALLYRNIDWDGQYTKCEIISQHAYDAMLELIKVMLNDVANKYCIQSFISLPIIYWEMFFVEYSDFLNKNNELDFFPKLSDEPDIKHQRVSVRDLIEGGAYVGGTAGLGTSTEGWRNTYIYGGRTKGKGFIWIFVGGYREILNGHYINYVRDEHDISVTKSNKVVYKPLYYDFRVFNLQNLPCYCYLENLK